MTIRWKLYTMVFGIISAFTIVVLFAVFTYIPLTRISKEAAHLRNLTESILNLRGDINSLSGEYIESQNKRIKKTKLDLDKKFVILHELKYLPKLNNDISEALKIIKNLQILFDTVWKDLEKNTELIMIYSEEVLFSSDVKISGLWSSPLADKETVFVQVNDFTTAILATDENLDRAYKVISKQFVSIENEISRRESFIAFTIFISIVVVFFITLILSFLIAKTIGKNIRLLEKGLSIALKGNLIDEIKIKSSDEIGKLGKNINTFTGELANSIRQIKRSSERNLDIKEQLIDSTIETSATSIQMNKSVQSIQDKISTLDKSVHASTISVATVQKSINGLNNVILKQIRTIEESTAAVTEMIASIVSVTKITNQKKENFRNLVDTAKKGGSQLFFTIQIIQEITSNIEEIRGIASIINNISEHTNLLAMNAAIEAAHAGNHGQGFSVVASEIRKLAEASAKNSNIISKVLKETVEKIESVSLSGEETRIAFDHIDRGVSGEYDSFEEIYNCMNDMSSGGQQILQTMGTLQKYSSDVQEGSYVISDSSSHLEEAVGIVKTVSSEVLGNISEVSIGISEISIAMDSLTDLSSNLSDIAQNLNVEINRFQT
ncbi:MAG: methyl-accepting chemotaxis protein [Spirochaetaceae bacterium]